MFELFITDNVDSIPDKITVKNKDKKTNADFSQLCEDTYGNLKNYIFRLADGDIYLTEEIIQDTYEYAAKSKKILQSHSNPKAWFYKTAKIFYLRHREKNKKIKNNEKKLSENVTEDENDFLINEYFNKFSYEEFKDTTVLDEIMAELSEKERELILCQFTDGLSVKKIAENWNENYEALRKFNYRLMKKIRKLLEEILHE
ncbi:MAG: sigma-70 family RNA polymerase sigma factor [Oscillospiraceae bacterium]|nr:sigma-70 family RNA polymerase sigma factor [Oscillospiraceae bacterium]